MYYFSYFPSYLADPTGTGEAKLATDILKRVRIRANMKKEIIMLDPYDVQDGETPEIIADKHHDTPHLHWVVMMTNNISDVNHDWVKSQRQMQMYLRDKYGDTVYDTHHYEIFQTSGDTTIKIQVENTTYPTATAVTNYEYEWAINEEKRSIDLLRNEYLSMFLEEFAELAY